MQFFFLPKYSNSSVVNIESMIVRVKTHINMHTRDHALYVIAEYYEHTHHYYFQQNERKERKREKKKRRRQTERKRKEKEKKFVLYPCYPRHDAYVCSTWNINWRVAI
jgi:hypothetical protein